MRGDPIIRLAIPGRKLHHRQVRCEKLERPRQLLHPRTITADHGETDSRRPPSAFGLDGTREIRDNEPFRAFRNVRERQRMAGRQQFRR